MNKDFKKALIAFVTFVSGLYFLLEFVLPEQIGGFEFGKYHQKISEGFQVVGVMAIGLGVINIFLVHGAAVLRTRKGWGNSLALLIGFFLMLAVEGGGFYQTEMNSRSWQEIANLELFSAQIRGDVGSEPQPAALTRAAERLEALADFSAQKLAVSERGEGYLAFPADLSTVPEEQARMIGELRRQLQSVADSARQTSAAYRELAANYAAGAAAPSHQELDQNINLAAESSKLLAGMNLESMPVRRGVELLRRGLFYPLGAAMFSLLAFYIANAAYRTFRVRSAEAFVMMCAAVVVILGQIPQGQVYIWEGLPETRLWLLKNLSTPANRAIVICSLIAGLAMAVRMWLSLERSPLAVDDNE